MSFSLTDKRKINLLRKTILAITMNSEHFYMQLYMNRVRVLSMVEDNTFTADMNQKFFNKFKALDELHEIDDPFIQLRIHKNEFLR